MGRKVNIPLITDKLQEELDRATRDMVRPDGTFSEKQAQTLIDLGVAFMVRESVTGIIIPFPDQYTGKICRVFFELQEFTLALEKIPRRMLTPTNTLLS